MEDASKYIVLELAIEVNFLHNFTMLANVVF